MTQHLIIADLHIDDFTTRNPEYRFNQPLILADRLIQIARERNIIILDILGDVLHNAVSRPRVLNQTYEFFNRVCSYFSIVRIIFGNHDFDDKRENMGEKDCSLFLNSFSGKLEYANNTLYVEDGVHLWYQDFLANGRISYPANADVYLGHFDVEHYSEPTPPLVIAGHIHLPVDNGCMHSIGTPYQTRISEPSENIGLLTLENGKAKFERISSSDETHQYVRMYYDEVPIEKRRENFPDLDVLVSRNSSVANVADISFKGIQLNISELRNKKFIDTVIASTTNNDEKLAEIHREVSKGIDFPDMVDRKFRVLSWELWNFRSVSHKKISLTTDKKIILFQGSNGSGKSTMINGLMIALLGEKKLYKWGRIGHEEECETEVTLEYQGKQYRIHRQCGDTRLYQLNGKDWTELTAKTKPDRDRLVYTVLPFLQTLDNFYIKPRSTFWGSIDKYQFFSDMFGLNLLDKYAEKAVEYEKRISAEVTKQTQARQAVQARIDALTKQITEYQEMMRTKFPNGNPAGNRNLNEELKRHQDVLFNRSKLEGILETIKVQLKTIETIPKKDWIDQQIQRNLQLANEWEAYTKELNSLQAQKRTLTTKLSQRTVTCPHCATSFTITGDDLKQLNAELSRTNQALASLKQPARMEYSIEQLNGWKYQHDSLNDLQTRYNQVKEQYESINADEHKSAVQSIRELQTTTSEFQLCQRSLVNYTNDLNTSKERLVEVQRLEDYYRQTYDSVLRYKSMFDFNNPDSIYRIVLQRITDCINTDTVRFTTITYTRSGEPKFQLGCSLKVGENWVDYDQISDGQLTRLDLILMAGFIKALDGVGIVVLDEILAYVSPNYYELMEEIISSINSNHIFITCQSPSFHKYDVMVKVQLVNGETQLSK